jgi:hypothetical protein
MKTIATLFASLFIFGMDASNNQLKLRMNGNGHYDEIVVVFDPAGSTSFNPDLDAWKLFSPVHTVGQIYTKCAPSEQLSVYAMPLSALDTTIDLYTLIGQSGSYTLSGTELSPFAAGQGIFLEDKTSGQLYDLRSGQTVYCTLPVLSLNSPSPFRLHFQKAYFPTVSSATSVSDSICSGSSYTFPDGSIQNNILSTVFYTSHLTGADGSDSAISTTVSVIPAYHLSESASVCSGGSYSFPDGTVIYSLTSDTVYTSQFRSIAGCDSTVATAITVLPVYHLTETVMVCDGSYHVFPDGFRMWCEIPQKSATANSTEPVLAGKMRGNFHISYLKTAAGCDSTIASTVVVIPLSVNAAVSDSVCSGSSYTFPDGSTQDTISSTLVHTSFFLNANGCDSSIVTTVSVRSSYALTVSASVCSGSSYSFPDGTVFYGIVSDTVYTSRLKSAGGCDSLIVTALTVSPAYHLNETVQTCSGSNYTFPDGFSMICRAPQQTANSNSVNALEENRMRGNFHISYLKTAAGCDSTIATTVLIVYPSNTAVSDSVCSGGSYTFPDGSVQDTIYSAMIHTSAFQNVRGCDSSVVTSISVRAAYTLSVTSSVCSGSSYVFPDGSTQDTISTGIVQTSHFQSAMGCDSTIVTTLTVNPVYNQSLSASVCSGASYTFPDGITLDTITSTTYHASKFRSIGGCDSIVVTTVNVNPVFNQAVSAAVCIGSSYSFPDGSTHYSVRTGLVHTSHLQSVMGCDSTIVTTVTVIPTNSQNVSVWLCSGSSYTFPDGSIRDTITATIVHSSHFQSTAGCDSVIVTTVSALPANIVNVSVSVCSGSGYTFPDGAGQDTITTAISHTSHLQSANGCDSIIVTQVSVMPLFTQTVSASVCMGATYTFPDGSTNDNITLAMQQTSKLQNRFGCDSLVVTLLAVNALPKVSINSTKSVVCAGSGITLSGQGANTYNWSSGIQDGVTFAASSTQRYFLTGADANNCKDTASIAIKVNPLPVISYLFDFADTLCQYAGNQHLCYASPAGGIYSGLGVSGVTFDPMVAGVGRHQILYNYTDSNSCQTTLSDTVLVVPAILTGIAQNAETVQVMIYPNPSSGSISLTSTVALNLISIYTASGKLVYRMKSEATEQKIDLSTWSAGVYMLEVQGRHYRVVRN